MPKYRDWEQDSDNSRRQRRRDRKTNQDYFEEDFWDRKNENRKKWTKKNHNRR